MSYFGYETYPLSPPTQTSVSLIGATTVLGAGAATYNKAFNITGAGGYTITLPAIDGVNYPYQSFSLLNTASALCTINVANSTSDTLLLLGSSYTSISLLPGERLLVQNLTTAWGCGLESASRTTTAPQFDNSIRSASTAFVQRALGNYSQYIPVTGTTTLTTAQAGAFVECSGSSTYTVTLPAPTTAGLKFDIANVSTSAVSFSLTTPSGNITWIGAGSAATQSLGANSNVTLASDGTNWLAIGGAGTSLISANGYQKLSSGFIIQWGGVPGFAGTVVVTYPLAFPNAVLSLVATAGATLTSNPPYAGTSVSGAGNSKTGFSVTAYTSSSALGGSYISIGY
jgi:hypothetical protein